jgi:ribosomal protein S15
VTTAAAAIAAVAPAHQQSGNLIKQLYARHANKQLHNEKAVAQYAAPLSDDGGGFPSVSSHKHCAVSPPSSVKSTASVPAITLCLLALHLLAAPLCCCFACSASYKNKENIDLSKVAAFAQHGSDVGSTAVQIARLSARVEQLTLHMQNNRKDFGSKRGLQAVLSQRKSLMQYLYRTDR